MIISTIITQEGADELNPVPCGTIAKTSKQDGGPPLYTFGNLQAE